VSSVRYHSLMIDAIVGFIIIEHGGIGAMTIRTLNHCLNLPFLQSLQKYDWSTFVVIRFQSLDFTIVIVIITLEFYDSIRIALPQFLNQFKNFHVFYHSIFKFTPIRHL
jgi:hypothetical protein